MGVAIITYKDIYHDTTEARIYKLLTLQSYTVGVAIITYKDIYHDTTEARIYKLFTLQSCTVGVAIITYKIYITIRQKHGAINYLPCNPTQWVLSL